MCSLKDSVCGMEWRDIPSAPGYKASRCGRVGRFAPAVTRTVPYALPGSINSAGYAKVKIVIGGKKVVRSVHRLVCEAWVGPEPEGKPHCCHNNGVPSDNRVENLRWDTCKGNFADKKLHGTETTGEKNRRAILTWGLVYAMREEFTGEYGEYARLSRKYGIAYSQAREIIKKESWWPEPEEEGVEL